MSPMNFPANLVHANVASNNSVKAVGDMHAALQRLGHDVSPSDIARKEFGTSTQEALRKFQKDKGLRADGKITQRTIAQLNAEVAHRFVTESKTRTQRVQALLQRLKIDVDATELKGRQFGPATSAAIGKFQAQAGLPEDGRASEAVVHAMRTALIGL